MERGLRRGVGRGGAREARRAPSVWPAAYGAARERLVAGTGWQENEERGFCDAWGMAGQMSFQEMVGCV